MYISHTAFRLVTGAIGVVLIGSGIPVIRGEALWLQNNLGWWFSFEGRSGRIAGIVLVFIGGGLIYNAITGA